MAKQRKIPLFCFDLTRVHGLGEADFIVCTDIDSGFVARVDMLNPSQVGAATTDNVTCRLVENENNKFGSLITIIRSLGKNPSDTARRTLLRKAAEKYKEITVKNIDFSNLTVDDYIGFLEILQKQGQQSLASTGSDFEARKVYESSITILSSLIDHLRLEKL